MVRRTWVSGRASDHARSVGQRRIARGLSGHQKPIPRMSIERGSGFFCAVRALRATRRHDKPAMRFQHQDGAAIWAKRVLLVRSPPRTSAIAPVVASANPIVKATTPAIRTRTRLCNVPARPISQCLILMLNFDGHAPLDRSCLASNQDRGNQTGICSKRLTTLGPYQ
jgi:hypothetical protein